MNLKQLSREPIAKGSCSAEHLQSIQTGCLQRIADSLEALLSILDSDPEAHIPDYKPPTPAEVSPRLAEALHAWPHTTVRMMNFFTAPEFRGKTVADLAAYSRPELHRFRGLGGRTLDLIAAFLYDHGHNLKP